MLHMRRMHDALESDAVVRCMLADASQHHGREFELAFVLGIRRALLPRLLATANSLIHVWASGDVDDEQAQNAEPYLMEPLASVMSLTHLPLVILGSGRAKLSHKFFATMYALYLTGSSHISGFKAIADSLAVLTSGRVAEFSLDQVRPMCV